MENRGKSGKKIGDGAHCWWLCWMCCFQGPVCISNYGKWGCAKCKNIKNISKKSGKIEAVGDDVTWCFQGPLYISLYGSAK